MLRLKLYKALLLSLKNYNSQLHVRKIECRIKNISNYMNINNIYQYFSWVCLTNIILAIKRQMYSSERLRVDEGHHYCSPEGATATGGRNVQKIIQILHQVPRPPSPGGRGVNKLSLNDKVYDEQDGHTTRCRSTNEQLNSPYTISCYQLLPTAIRKCELSQANK